MGLYIVPAGDDKPPQGNGRRPKEIALLQAGTLNPIKRFLLPSASAPLPGTVCFSPWWPWGDSRDTGQGLRDLLMPAFVGTRIGWP